MARVTDSNTTVDDLFRYVDKTGREWVSDVPMTDVWRPGLLRRNRTNDVTLTMEACEGLFKEQPEFLALIDDSWDEMTAVMRAFLDHIRGVRPILP